MSQKKIHEFFKFKDENISKKYSFKKYFYLNFSNKLRPDYEAVWLDKRPQNINFIQEINCNYIKKGYYYFLCGYFPDYEEEKKFNLNKESKYKNIPNLKSHLQKCIRKQDDTLAIQTANHFIKLDEIEFIRRLPIIMLEDVFLHESFTTIIWIMIALSHKKFKMNIYIYKWLFGIIYVLCKINKKDKLGNDLNIIVNNNTNDNNNTNHNEILSISEIIDNYGKNNLDDNEISLLYSIHIRISYGCMDNDKIMLEKYANLWFNRFKNKDLKVVNKMIIKPIKLDISELNLEDWDLSAIDFHCNNKLLEFINKKYEDISLEELKKLIWHNSSKINKRVKNKIYNEELWNKIKDYVIKTQKYLLESSY
jgi:hypothetical protein